MRFHPLASSSHGNAYLVEDGVTALLIECGVSFKKLQKLVGFRLSGVQACLISHEHKDHAGCYEQLIKNGIPVYASEGTAEALECDLLQLMADREPFTIDTLDVLPFPTFHDAAEPMGFLIRSQEDGETLVFATDTANLAYQFPGVNIVCIECNYDEGILSRSERMPEKVRQRIANAHMSVRRACIWLAGLDMSRVRAVYLMHLSDSTSNEWMFRRMVRDVVPPGVEVIVCPKEKIERSAK